MAKHYRFSPEEVLDMTWSQLITYYGGDRRRGQNLSWREAESLRAKLAEIRAKNPWHVL